jgi:hypothetical protein
MHRCRGGFAALALVALAPLVNAGLARAATTTIGFDDLPGGTTLGTQYESRGVIFGEGPFGATVPEMVENVGSQTHSPPNAATIASCPEVPSIDADGAFTAGRHQVSVFVGNPFGVSGQLTLTGYNQNSQAIVSDTGTVPAGGPVATPLSISDPGGNIWYFRITAVGPAFKCPLMDDLSFDVPSTPPAPDFGIAALSTGVTVAAGNSLTVALTLHRFAGSSGPITLSANGLPQGVSASLAPNPDSGDDGSSITLTLTAAADAPPTTAGSVTVTGTPSASAGSQPRSVTIPVAVSGNFDLKAQGLEVTQGVQSNGFLYPAVGDSGGSYSGVPLIAATKTVVRFYADAIGAPQGGVPGVGAVLHGFRNGVELPNSPLYPDYGPAALPDVGEGSLDPVAPSERTSDTNAFTFTLPWLWTTGTITLVADVLPPPPSFGGPQFLECTSPICQADNAFMVNGVTFNPGPTIDVTTIGISLPGDAPLPPPTSVFSAALAITPGGAGVAVYPYSAMIQPTPQLLNLIGSDRNTDYGEIVQSWAGNLTPCDLDCIPYGLPQDFVVGITRDQRGVTMGGWNLSALPLFNPAPGQDPHLGIAVVNPSRPLTSVAHELGHLLGRNHADVSQQPPGCGGNGGPWPPDGKGFIEGIGLDTRTTPFKIIAPGLPSEPSQWFDWMSYCASINESTANGNLPDAWISDRNWNADVSDELAFGQRQLAGGTFGQQIARARGHLTAGDASGRRSARAAGGGPMLTVLANGGAGGAQFVAVLPTRGRTAPLSASTPFVLSAVSSSGHVLSQVPMSGSVGHSDLPDPKVFYSLEAQVPTGAVHALRISDNGVVVATKVRPRHLPHVRIIAPTAGERVGGLKPVTVRWRATDADHVPLTIYLDYSPDNGSHWHTVFVGANRGSVRLPAFFFASSSRARARVRANDGFDQTQAVSARFRALDPPPQVAILDPAGPSRIPGNAVLALRGAAFDASLHRLTGRSLTWTLSGTLLGRGEAIVASALPPGVDRITLLARDAHGRIGRATVAVYVGAVRLSFLSVAAPKHLSRHAGRLQLTVASALPATLRIRTRVYPITGRPLTISVRIRPGRTRIVVTMWVTAQGLTQPVVLAIPRR